MKHNGITLFSILVLLVFAGSIFYFFNTIRIDYKNGLPRAEKIFEEISSQAKKNPEQLKKEMFSGEETVHSAKYTKNNRILIAYPDEQTSSQVSTTKLVKIFSKTIVEQENTYELKLALYILRPAVIYNAARQSFIIILGATLATIGVLIFISVKSKKGVPAETETEESTPDENPQEIEIEEENTGIQDAENAAEDDSAQENIPETEETEIPEDFSDSNSEQENESSSEEPEIELPDSDSGFDSDSVETENQDSGNENDSEAYYNEHKIMQEARNSFEGEASLNERINFELTKAASNGQDFSVLLIEIKDSEKFADIKKFLDDNYGKENIFNYKPQILALLKENTNIDDAEDKAALIENNIKAFFEEQNLAIGISSRSLRTITADRILSEAEEALNHANSDPDSKIVGFHVDLEKYREFVENSQKAENDSE